MNKAILKEIAFEQEEYQKSLKIENETERAELSKIKKLCPLPHSIIISGIRRCGKSVLMRQIRKKFYAGQGYYFNFEDERLVNFDSGKDFNYLFEVLVELFGEKKVFFLDEIQNVSGWESFVRRMQDRGFKFFISGSNAHLLSRELGTKLTGRHVSVTMYPFSFREYLTREKYKFSAGDFLETGKKAKLQKLFQDYLQSGGMPEYLASGEPRVLRAVYEDILYKDVAVRYDIREIKALRELALYLSTNISGLFSYNKLKNMLNLGSSNTVKSYMDYLESSFLFFSVDIFSYSLKKQIANPKKNYIIDNGIANLVASQFSPNSGKLLENLVFLELKRNEREVFYYRGKKECDFVLKQGSKISQVIQVTSYLDEKNEARELSGLFEAMDEFGLKKGIILTESQDEKRVADSKNIEIKPVWKWLLENVI